MAFKFNFGVRLRCQARTDSRRVGQRGGAAGTRIEALSEAHTNFTKEDQEEVVTPDGHRLRKHRLRAQHLARFPQLQPVIQRSDLEPAVYEGGFKLWECSIDLVDWLAARESVAGLRVLELGCGHGLPGLWCLTKGASVDFADYVRRRIVHFGVCLIAWPTQNEEVLAALTIPNAQLNAPDALSRCRFIAGDWSLLSELVASGAYDLVLCSEVLYFVSAYAKLLDLLQRCIRPTGKILIASKLYYFSCGGGTRQFEELVDKSAVLSSSVVKHIEDQQSNIREILQLQFKRSAH